VATTVFFEEVLTDKSSKELTMELEVGRSSAYGENHLYLRVDETTVILDEKVGRSLCEAFESVGHYLSYTG